VSVPSRLSAAICVASLALSACSAPAPQHRQAPPGSARPVTTPWLSFPQLEGVYEQPGRAFVVTYQGWWLDLTSQQIRQLTPGRGGTFTYGPGWQDPAPAQGQLHFTTNAAGAPVRVTGLGPGRVPVHATRLPVTQRDVRIPSQDAVLAGTLTTPPGPGAHPGIMILQGSGALDRHFESISQEIT
jgi:hypothetical protein